MRRIWRTSNRAARQTGGTDSAHDCATLTDRKQTDLRMLAPAAGASIQYDCLLYRS
jgi:hypothetical protein